MQVLYIERKPQWLMSVLAVLSQSAVEVMRAIMREFVRLIVMLFPGKHLSRPMSLLITNIKITNAYTSQPVH